MKKLIVILILLCASQAWAEDYRQNHYEIRLFDLCYEYGESIKSGPPNTGTTIFIARECQSYDNLQALNRLLSEGWELQEPYRGEDKVYLRRRSQK